VLAHGSYLVLVQPPGGPLLLLLLLLLLLIVVTLLLLLVPLLRQALLHGVRQAAQPLDANTCCSGHITGRWRGLTQVTLQLQLPPAHHTDGGGCDSRHCHPAHSHLQAFSAEQQEVPCGHIAGQEAASIHLLLCLAPLLFLLLLAAAVAP
jgi:hypothetical protein